MDNSLRSTPGLIARIERLRDDLIKRFESIMSLAAVDKTDRNTTSATQYQMQVETAALIRASRDMQTLVRNLQEMWLFGQLKTVGEPDLKNQANENAKIIASMLKRIAEKEDSIRNP